MRGGEYTRTHGTDDVGGAGRRRSVRWRAGGRSRSPAAWPRLRRSSTPSHRRSSSSRRSATSACDRCCPSIKLQGHVELRPVDITDTAAVAAAAVGADVVWVETPTNPTLDVADLPAIAAASRDAGAQMVVDSTFATPLLQRPLEHGAPIVLHSGTKFIGGHSDLLIGLCVTADDASTNGSSRRGRSRARRPARSRRSLRCAGCARCPSAWPRCSATPRCSSNGCAAHPAVAEVRYPGQGAMVSFVVAGGAAAADALCAGVRVIVPATSLGGVETTIERRQKYAGDAHVAAGLLRMSVGIEDVDDLWADLDANLASLPE